MFFCCSSPWIRFFLSRFCSSRGREWNGLPPNLSCSSCCRDQFTSPHPIHLSFTGSIFGIVNTSQTVFFSYDRWWLKCKSWNEKGIRYRLTCKRLVSIIFGYIAPTKSFGICYGRIRSTRVNLNISDLSLPLLVPLLASLLAPLLAFLISPRLAPLLTSLLALLLASSRENLNWSREGASSGRSASRGRSKSDIFKFARIFRFSRNIYNRRFAQILNSVDFGKQGLLHHW
jgi:hypothetical protein